MKFEFFSLILRKVFNIGNILNLTIVARTIYIYGTGKVNSISNLPFIFVHFDGLP